MTRRTLFVISLLAAAAAAAGCQLVSGASSLDIVDDAGVSSETSSRLDATDEAIRPLPDGSTELEAAAEADAPFVACTVLEGGALTPCAQGGIADVATCVEYCATKGKCCAEDCKPLPDSQTIEAAQLNADTLSACIEPVSGQLETFDQCRTSLIPAKDRYFTCCCR